MLVITPKILDKLYYKHGIADGFKMARLALNNINGNLLVDTREKKCCERRENRVVCS